MNTVDPLLGQDAPYTNREIREHWHDVKNDLQEIKLQTQATNGSVANINKWRERMNGGAIVAGVFMTVVVIPILIWSISILVNIKETIHNSVVDTLQAYDINLK